MFLRKFRILKDNLNFEEKFRILKNNLNFEEKFRILKDNLNFFCISHRLALSYLYA